jgi:adenylylsulfate reductase, subunit B
MPPIINKEECSSCGECMNICPQDVFFGTEDGNVPVIRYPDECWHCNACVVACPVEAIKLRIPLPMMICYK